MNGQGISDGQPIGTVIVGAGLMGYWHAHAVSRLGGRITAVVDADPARAAALASRHRGARIHGDLTDALRAGAAHAVHICTPLRSHAELAHVALDGGCHVLVEKPLADGISATEELLRRAASVGRQLCPVHQFLFQPGALRAAALLPSLGALLHVEAEVASTGAERSTASADEVALEILPHALAFAARFCPAAIDGARWTSERARTGELFAHATVGGAHVAARISMGGRPPVNALRIVAEGGTIHLDLFHGYALVDRSGSSRGMKVARPALAAARQGLAVTANLASRLLRREPAYPGLRELVLRFHDAVRGAAPPIPASEVLAVARVWEGIRSQVRAASQ